MNNIFTSENEQNTFKTELKMYLDIYQQLSPKNEYQSTNDLISKRRSAYALRKTSNSYLTDIVSSPTIDKNIHFLEAIFTILLYMDNQHNAAQNSLIHPSDELNKLLSELNQGNPEPSLKTQIEEEQKKIIDNQLSTDKQNVKSLLESLPKLLTATANTYQFESILHKVFFRRLYYFIPDNLFISRAGESRKQCSLKEYKIPIDYFPLYYSLLSCISKYNMPWKHIKEQIEKRYNTILKEHTFKADIDVDSYVAHNAIEAYKKYYAYWLDILFPDELYELLRTIAKVMDSQKYYYIRYNISLIFSLLDNGFFLTPAISNYFFKKINDQIAVTNEHGDIRYTNFNPTEIMQLAQDLHYYEQNAISQL